MDEEKRRHAETIKILRKKERNLKEIIIQGEEDHKNVTLLQETVDKLNQKVNLYKRQLQEQVINPIRVIRERRQEIINGVGLNHSIMRDTNIL